MDYLINVDDVQAFVDAAQPAREQMRFDLARAMSYTVQEVGELGKYCYQLANPSNMEPRYHQWRRTEAEAWADAPDPFTGHADCHALVAWLLKTQSEPIKYQFISEIFADWSDGEINDRDWEEMVMVGLLASPETIAAAAWQAIQERQ